MDELTISTMPAWLTAVGTILVSIIAIRNPGGYLRLTVNRR